MELTVIGRSKRPRAFKGKSGSELGFDFYHNKKSWMTTVLFFDWLRRSDAFIGRTRGSKAVLLMDNCSAHGDHHWLPELQNVELIFLPPNTTLKSQRMYPGIIAAMNLRYRKVQLERALDLTDEDICVGDIYKVDLLTGMKWFKKIWLELPKQFIATCFKKPSLLDECYGSWNASVPALICDVDLNNETLREMYVV